MPTSEDPGLGWGLNPAFRVYRRSRSQDNDAEALPLSGLPLGLRTALETGGCVLFIGAGVGAHAVRTDGTVSPSGEQLARDLATKFEIDPGDRPDLPKVAQLVELRHGRELLDAFLLERLSELEPDPVLQWLFSRPWRAIFTTNYDRVIERSYELIREPTQQPVTITSDADLVRADPRFDVEVFHLHGSLFEGTHRFALVTQTDYTTFRRHRQMLFEILKQNYATSPIMYVGYSNTDPNWRLVTEELREQFQPNTPPTSYRVDPNTPALDKELLTSQGIVSIDLSLSQFADLVRAELGEERIRPFDPLGAEGKVPPDLLDIFRDNPAPVLRLLNSWTYVNQADFSSPANVANFLDGDHPNWSLIAGHHHFVRDAEASVLDELFDFATEPGHESRAVLVTGPAGFGTTTLLMSAAVSMVNDQAGKVFYLRSGREVLQGDVDFILSAFREPIFFFVDNAAEHADNVSTNLQLIRGQPRRACFVLGERLNEWRQTYARVPAREYQIEPLSDGEISRLVACLDRHGALGKLEKLDDSLRRAAIRQLYNKDLLVVMKEATEGLSFNTIIDDEYRGIVSDFAQRLYAVVCGFSRLKSLCRDSVLAGILGCELQEIYSEQQATEGVVFWDAIDEARGMYGARARHHLIAEVVWQRSLDAVEREQMLLGSIAALNLNHGVDAKAFERLIRSDGSLAEIGSLEAKVSFFETACVMDPRSPYVRQHYARMLRREGRLELALDQIDHALRLDPDVRVLHHTKGVILGDMAEAAPGHEVSRRRMAQAEKEFRHTIATSARDDYGYVGLAELYLSWAKRSDNAAEAAAYVRRCEEAITDGLRSARVKDSLWMQSAKVEEWLGDHPGALAALERAVKASPKAEIPRYLLGRTHYRGQRYAEVLGVLRPVLEAGTDDHRIVSLYARALLKNGSSFQEAAAVLSLGELYGMRDSHFVALFGGVLFMAGEYKRAKDVFSLGRRQGFRVNEADAVGYEPTDAARDPIRLNGRVVTVRSGYCFLRADPYPDDWFLPGVRYRGIDLREGQHVAFSPGFTARGPIALRPEPAPT